MLAEGPMSATGTLMDGIANMANSILGAGIIGLPYAIRQAGFVTGVTLLIVLAVVTDWTIRLVVLNAKLSGRDSYIDVMYHCFGPIGASAVSFFQFAFAFGGMCAFNVIIGDSIPPVIRFVFPFLAEHAVLNLLVNRNFIIFLATATVSFPLSLHRDIVKLSKSSSFALISMGVIVASVVLRGVSVDPSLRGSSLDVFSIMKPGVFEAIGVISFAFVCHHNTMFIYKSIQMPTLDRFNAVTHTSTGLSLVCCLLMSVTGYLVFTDKTEGNILNNFAADDWVINFARFCFGANMSTTIPLENYVCREVIEDYYFKDRGFSHRRHVVVTSLIVFSAMFISLLTCDLGVVLEIAGGLSATALAFIFPAAAYYTLVGGSWHSKSKLPAVLCTTFGIVVLVLSCGITITKTLRGEVSHKKCT
ncbi:Vacuolar amino acid transporter 2 [Vanrija pseudolonga]|uniref:Vacuolar amino acid transporter 2 n=1 Tax=Vanrija pseudolonga TaxID=143232 RepID=A0AAF0XZY2_9TREE|nr:Vacuolar amino acid transporter 2 [Vanrija pseudolonga]